MSQTNDTTDTTADTTTGGLNTADNGVGTVPVSDLLKQKGTVPFLGFTPDTEANYPEPVTPVGDRFDQASPLSFRDAINCLPKAGEGTLWAENEFVDGTGGSIEIDLDAISDVHGLDLEGLEAATSQSVEQLAEAASPEPLIRVSDHKDIIDRRRLALRALGFDVKFRWQIASDSYDPGDMQTFLNRKIAACQKQGIEQVFGWVRFHDWGGAVQIVSIYPDLAHEVDPTEESDEDEDQDELDEWFEDADDQGANADGDDESDRKGDGDGDDESDRKGDADEQEEEDEQEEKESANTTTVYYGDRVGYGFRGTQKIYTHPIIYIPSLGVMIPLPKPRFDRKHVGDVMDEATDRSNNRLPLIKWHESVLDDLKNLTSEVNDEIRHARTKVIDFETYPFDVAEFYSCLGIPDEYAEEAAERVTSLAAPSHRPTLWNLQLSLKLALLDEFRGVKAGDTYQGYQEIAGQLLRFPAQQFTLAIEQYEKQQDEDDDAPHRSLPDDQQSLADVVDDITELPGVKTEDDLSDQDAQEISERVQRRLGNLS